MDSYDSFREKVISDYYKWYNINRKELEPLSINERINKYLEHEKIKRRT
jgi:hypothetical protein